MGRAGRSGGGFKGGGSFGGGGFGGRSGGSRGFGGRTSSSIGRNRGSTPSGGFGNSGIFGGTSGRNNSSSTSRNNNRSSPRYIPVPYPSKGRSYSPYPSGSSRNTGGWGGGPNPSPGGGNYTSPKERKSPKNPKESFRTALFFIIPVMIISVLILIFNPGGNQEAPTPLDSGAVIKTEYYTDELGWIHNSSVLEEGMELFYERTGVQPYLYLTDNVDGKYNFTSGEVKTFLENKYDQLFQDEAHLILLFTEHEGMYTTWYLTGAQAKTVIGDKEGNIILDYVDRYYYSDYDEDTYFSKVFAEASAEIMRKPVPFPQIGAILVLVISLAIIFYYRRAIADYERKVKAQETKDILSTPLEEIVDQNLRDLEKKYSQQEADPEKKG